MEVEEAGNQIVAVEKDGFMNRYEGVYIEENQLISEFFELAPPTSGFPGMLFGYVYDKTTSKPVVGIHVVEINGVEIYSDENGRNRMMIKVYNQEAP